MRDHTRKGCGYDISLWPWEFHQSFNLGGILDKDKLVRFWGEKIKSQGHSETKYDQKMNFCALLARHLGTYTLGRFQQICNLNADRDKEEMNKFQGKSSTLKVMSYPFLLTLKDCYALVSIICTFSFTVEWPRGNALVRFSDSLKIVISRKRLGVGNATSRLEMGSSKMEHPRLMVKRLGLMT